VEQFIVEHGIAAEIIRIDGNSAARQALIEINDGYASVPESATGRTSHIKAILTGTGE
jgi:hypothetical protein